MWVLEANTSLSHPQDKPQMMIKLLDKNTKIIVPKESKDIIAFQKEQRTVKKELKEQVQIEQISKLGQNSYLYGKLKKPKHLNFVQKEQVKYKEACLEAEFIKLVLVLKEKELEVVVPGYFAFLFLTTSLQILKQTPFKTIERIRQFYQLSG